MRMLRSLFATLCLLVLGAHLLRAGWPSGLLAILLLLAATLAWLPRLWAQRATALLLALGALEWVRTLLVLRAARMALGLPSTRMTLILGLVAAATACMAFALARPRPAPAPGA